MSMKILKNFNKKNKQKLSHIINIALKSNKFKFSKIKFEIIRKLQSNHNDSNVNYFAHSIFPLTEFPVVHVISLYLKFP